MENFESYLSKVYEVENFEELRLYLALNPSIEFIKQAALSFALAAIEQDRKDCAEKATAGLGLPVGRIRVDKSSILDRPLPELK